MNLQIDQTDFIEMTESEAREIKHLNWILQKIHLNDSAKKIYSKDLLDLVLESKVRCWNICRR